MREAEAKFLKHSARRLVSRMMAGEERARPNAAEGERDHRDRCFLREPFPPMRRSNVKPEFVNPFFEFVWPQAGASGELIVRKQEHRPILNAVGGHGCDFAIKARLYLFRRKRPADPSRDFGISPESKRERQIVRGPLAEA